MTAIVTIDKLIFQHNSHKRDLIDDDATRLVFDGTDVHAVAENNIVQPAESENDGMSAKDTRISFTFDADKYVAIAAIKGENGIIPVKPDTELYINMYDHVTIRWLSMDDKKPPVAQPVAIPHNNTGWSYWMRLFDIVAIVVISLLVFFAILCTIAVIVNNKEKKMKPATSR